MLLKEAVERAFGDDAENRVLRFLLEKELDRCHDGAQRWPELFGRCEKWRKQFLLWEENVYVSGVSGWNLEMNVCKLRLPQGADDWTEYLYRVTLLTVVGMMSASERNRAAAYHDFSSGLWFSDYRVGSGFADLTKEQWLGEVTGLLNRSWELYQRFPGNSDSYQRDMERSYPKFDAALGYLAQDVGECEVVRMNRHGGDETVWYFVKAWDCFYLMWLSDHM